MNRRAVVAGLGAVLANPLGAAAQPAAKMPRVGLLGIGSSASSPDFEALRQGLRELGWVQGQSISFEDRTAVGDYSQIEDVAAELVRLKVDVIATSSTTAALAARKATKTIPIVTIVGSDPVEMGLAASLARPGGNVTGLAYQSREVLAKRMELLKETIPRLSRIAILWDRESRTQALTPHHAEPAARSLGLQIRRAEVRRTDDLEAVFASVARERPDALVLAPSQLFRAHRSRVIQLAARHRLPASYSDRSFVEEGGLMSYGSDSVAIFHGLAKYVDRVLKGARPGDLPIEQPTKFELVINLKTAKALALTIPPSLLLRADQVIE